MTQISGAWLNNNETQAVFQMLKSEGFQAYVVGGSVRNSLLKEPVADVDFATDARPDQVIKSAKKAGIRSIATGIDHGTITLISGSSSYEVTTFRKDVETDGRHAVVAFADTIDTDAHRRDFTINALYADETGQVFDPLGGLADIKTRHVRFIDDARDRILEDRLRILRFFRFHAWFADPSIGIDAEALAACAELADGLKGLSKERVGAEMRKLLSATDPAPSLASMEHSGVLHRVLPGASTASVAQLVHFEGEFGIAPNWLCRLACLGGQEQVDALRLSRADAQKLRLYLGKIGETAGLPELAYRNGADAAVDIYLLRAALLGTELPQDLVAVATNAAARVFPVKAGDITTGETGPELGAKLRHLETEWIASQFTKSRDVLLS
ncbi:MAG: poly(A) polymerase [Paracoccaceae bacterium]|jgi:poly(A) polymerase